MKTLYFVLASALLAVACGGRLLTMLRSVVLGCGSYLPARVVSNAELAKTVEIGLASVMMLVMTSGTDIVETPPMQSSI